MISDSVLTRQKEWPMRTGLACAAALALVAGAATTDLRLPRVLVSNMLLQREKPVRIWGWARNGEAGRVCDAELERSL